jgi:hypothetical protein
MRLKTGRGSDTQTGKESAMPRPRLTLMLSAAVVALAVCALAPRAAHAQAKGKIYVSDVEYGSWGSEKEMAGAIKRQSKTTIKGENGVWALNFMVFLNAAPGAEKINIVYYDLSKKHEQVDFAEISVKPDQKIVQLNGQAVSKEKGFVKGHTYDVRATRLIGGKEKVYAKATITLK